MGNLEDSEFTLDSNHASNRVKHLNHILNHFSNRWRMEYLSELREVHSNIAKKRPKGGDHSQISIGSIVIVHDDHLPRDLWKLGRIEEVLRRQDGLIRGAVIKVACCDQQHLVLRRPIQLLYPLKVHSQQPESTPETQVPPDEVMTEGDDVNGRAHPKRAFSKRAEELRKGWIAELEKDGLDY